MRYKIFYPCLLLGWLLVNGVLAKIVTPCFWQKLSSQVPTQTALQHLPSLLIEGVVKAKVIRPYRVI